MLDKKDKIKTEPKPRDDGVELENQFILRLPEEVAKTLHEALQTGNLKDRMTIKLDTDLRYGEVQLDNWLLHAKVVDLPTILECLKTIDSKSFYKSADICQLMICKEEADALDTEKESPVKGKKKDPNKVDKKYLWPHGITPPCKNVRKRRFRKVLKKKNVEAPEIEKEVKRLLRNDNDAVKVDFEIINEELDKRPLEHNEKEFDEDEFLSESLNELDKINDSSSQKDINVESDGEYDERPTTSAAISGVGEHDIFGGEVSSSDDERYDEQHSSSRLQDMEDASHLSADDSRLTDLTNTKDEPTQFSQSMFDKEVSMKYGDSNSNLGADDCSNDPSQMSKVEIQNKITKLRREHEALLEQQDQKYDEITTIQNPTLKQRMKEIWQNLVIQVGKKESELREYERLLEGGDSD